MLSLQVIEVTGNCFHINVKKLDLDHAHFKYLHVKRKNYRLTVPYETLGVTSSLNVLILGTYLCIHSKIHI